MLGIKMPRTEKKIIVNEDKQTVTTILYNADDTNKFKFVGVAKCSPDDNFDVDVGAKISYRRAKIAMLRQGRDSVRLERDRVSKYVENYQKIYDNIQKNINKLMDEIDNLANNG